MRMSAIRGTTALALVAVPLTASAQLPDGRSCPADEVTGSLGGTVIDVATRVPLQNVAMSVECLYRRGG